MINKNQGNPFSLGHDLVSTNNIMEYSTAENIALNTGIDKDKLQDYLLKVATNPVGTPGFTAFMNEVNPPQKFKREKRFKVYETENEMEDNAMAGTQAKAIVDANEKKINDIMKHWKD